MLAGEDGERLLAVRFPNVDGWILADLTRRDDVAELLSVVHSHGDDVVVMLRVELLRARANAMDDASAGRRIDDELVADQVEQVVATVEAAIAVDVIQLQVLQVVDGRERRSSW